MFKTGNKAKRRNGNEKKGMLKLMYFILLALIEKGLLIKPANFLISEDIEIKIISLGVWQ